MFYTAKHLVFGFNIILIILLLGTTLGASLSYGQPLEASIFTLTYDDEHIPYSYSDLTNLETYSGLGGRLNVLGEVVGPFEYTGVHISTLLDQIPDAPAVANIVVISSDGYVYTFSYDQINGNVIVYNANGTQIGIGGVEMILAYKEEGVPNFSGGPLRIAWVDTHGLITDAFLWSKNVAEIQIVQNSSDDTTAPVLTIEKPSNGLYFFNRRFFPFPRTIIFGRITIQVEAYDEGTSVARVLFVIDEEIRSIQTGSTCEWIWDEKTSGSHGITVIAYDIRGNIISKQQNVWIFHG